MNKKWAVKRITVNIARDLAEKLEKFCDQTGRPATDVIRELIRGLPGSLNIENRNDSNSATVTSPNQESPSKFEDLPKDLNSAFAYRAEKFAFRQITLDLTPDEAENLEKYSKGTGKAVTTVIEELIQKLPVA